MSNPLTTLLRDVAQRARTTGEPYAEGRYVLARLFKQTIKPPPGRDGKPWRPSTFHWYSSIALETANGRRIERPGGGWYGVTVPTNRTALRRAFQHVGAEEWVYVYVSARPCTSSGTYAVPIEPDGLVACHLTVVVGGAR